MKVVVHLRDGGCVQNALPVAKFLHRQGVDVALLVDEGSFAEGKLGELPFSRLSRWRDLEAAHAAVSCLPPLREEDAAALRKRGIPVVLVAESPDSGDPRLQEWLAGGLATAVCTLTEVQAAEIAREWGIPAYATGLPVVDTAAEKIAAVDTAALCAACGIQGKRIVSLALGKDEEECLTAIDAVAPVLKESDLLIARVHPALPEGARERVAARLAAVGAMPLSEAQALSPWEAMALAAGDGVFVAAHNSTMLAQAAGAGIRAAALLPAGASEEEWEWRLPLLRGGHITFFGERVFNFTPAPLPRGEAAEKIAELVLGIEGV